MGKNNSETGKQRRIQKKNEQMQLNEAWKKIATAIETKDDLQNLASFKKYVKNNKEFYISSHLASELDDSTKTATFSLLKSNMLLLYESCDWGWSDKKKFDELYDKAARYLIVKDTAGKIVGFSHYRFDMDYGVEVLYMYELQLVDDVKRCGLGKFLVQTLELIAFKNNMKKIVLTVLKNNYDALEFFKSMNYLTDETCPSYDIYEDSCYVILSKKNRRLLETT